MERAGEDFSDPFHLSWLDEPETILPEQFYESEEADQSGELDLLWRVLVDGIQTYCREVLCGATHGLTFREVQRWIFRPDSDAITSFANLCELFHINPIRTRRLLSRFRENPREDPLVHELEKLGWIPFSRRGGRSEPHPGHPHGDPEATS